MDIDRFKQQHVQILQIIKRMRGLVQAGIAEHAREIAQEVLALRSRVKSHLSIEDDILYPRIKRNPDQRVAALADAYQDEMKGLAVSFLDFTSRWSLPANIAAAPEEFRRDANVSIKLLHQRIQRENTEFYPLVEQI